MPWDVREILPSTATSAGVFFIQKPFRVDLLRRAGCLVDVNRVLVQAVVVADGHVPANAAGQEGQQRVEGRVKQVLTLPVDLGGDQVEGHADLHAIEYPDQQPLKIVEHL